MSKNPMPPVAPYLFYEDVSGALSWLSKAFGDRRYDAEDPESHQISGTSHNPK